MRYRKSQGYQDVDAEYVAEEINSPIFAPPQKSDKVFSKRLQKIF